MGSDGQIRMAIGMELLTASFDISDEHLMRDRLQDIHQQDGMPGLIEALLGVIDVGHLLLLQQRDLTGKTLPSVLGDLGLIIQARDAGPGEGV